MKFKPYVSFVIVGRNDDYGADFLNRINTFIRSLDHQVAGHPDVFELVVVEWNPMPDKQPLDRVLYRPHHLHTRIITVAPELHDRIGASHPVLEFHGKNVGIRRAKGEFVAVSNPDILFTQELIDELAKRRLRVDTVYRTDRYDFLPQGISEVATQHLIDFAVSRTFVMHGMGRSSSISAEIEGQARSLNDLPRSEIKDGVMHTNACGDFMLAAKEAFFTVRGMYETTAHRWHVDSISLYRFHSAKIRQQVWQVPLCVFHQHHDRKPEDVKYGDIDVWGLARASGTTSWGLIGENLQECVLPKPLAQNHLMDLIQRVKYGIGDSDRHVLTLFSIALQMQARKILELGSRTGTTTLPFVLAAKELGGIVDSVDKEALVLRADEFTDHWRFHHSDTIQWLQQQVSTGAKYDIVYIDDWHSYDHVKRELELVAQLITPSSLVIMHDLMYADAQPCYRSDANSQDPQWHGGGPYRAVAELDAQTWEWATIPVNNGLTVLRQRAKEILK